MSNVNYYWIEGRDASEEEWERIESVLAARGWMSLNRATTIRILLAEDEQGTLLGFLVAQFTLQCGPMFVIPSKRGTPLAQELADKMLKFLVDSEARGWFVVADSPHIPSMCEERGMKKLTSPIYVAGGMGEPNAS